MTEEQNSTEPVSTEPYLNQAEPALFATASEQSRGTFPWKPAAAAALGLAVVVGALLFFGRAAKPAAQFATADVAPPDAYAASLPITDIKMSEADSYAGNKATYIDGKLTNSGAKTVTNAFVQVVFQDDMGQMAQKEVLPVGVIRAHEPYVDTVQLPSAPLKPGQSAEFRLIFDHVSGMWNQQYPQLTVVKTELQ